MRLRVPSLAVCALAAAPSSAQTLTRVANLAVSGISNGIAITSNRAYVSDYGNATLQVFDISTPAAPVLRGSVAANTRPRAIAAAGSMAYILGFGLGSVNSSDLKAFNVTNPAVPAAGPAVVLGAPPVYITASSALVCAAAGSTGVVKVFDSALNLLSTINGNGVTNAVLNGNVLYLSTTTGLGVYDLTTPGAPVLVRTVTGAIGAVSGNRACGFLPVSSASTSLYSYDVSTPLNPVLLGSTAVAGGYTLVAATPTTAFIGQVRPGIGSANLPLQAFAIGSAAAPVLLASAPVGSAGTQLAASGNSAYLVDEYNSAVHVYTLAGVTTATRSAQSLALGLFPNPAHASLRLTPPNPAAPVVVYDLAGRECLSTRVATGSPLDISTLPAGVYVVRNGSAAQSLVVE